LQRSGMAQPQGTQNGRCAANGQQNKEQKYPQAETDTGHGSHFGADGLDDGVFGADVAPQGQ
jgi:hypothetical protein